MSLKIALLLIALAGVSGIGIGYFLRLIITLGKRGSMELLVRKMTLDAESKAKNIIEEAENRADERAREILNEFKEKKNEEIQKTKEDVEKTIRAEREKLEKIAHLSEEEAKSEILKGVEKRYESDIEGRMRKLEIAGNERLEARAREILTTSVHRLGNSVVSDVLATTITIPTDEIK